MPSDREHKFSQGSKSTCYEHVCLVTANSGRAEPLFRRALAIFEASLGPDHPDFATQLNNLALLLQATTRLGEAEPLMRRMVTIFFAFQHSTGHAHPHRETAIANYTSLLEAMGRSGADIEAAIADLWQQAERSAG